MKLTLDANGENGNNSLMVAARKLRSPKLNRAAEMDGPKAKLEAPVKISYCRPCCGPSNIFVRMRHRKQVPWRLVPYCVLLAQDQYAVGFALLEVRHDGGSLADADHKGLLMCKCASARSLLSCFVCTH